MCQTNKILISLRLCAGLAILAVSLSGEKGKAAEATNAADYSVAAHWMYLPATNKIVDVFYLYPTAWTSTNQNPEICAIDNLSMLQQAPQAILSFR